MPHGTDTREWGRTLNTENTENTEDTEDTEDTENTEQRWPATGPGRDGGPHLAAYQVAILSSL